MRDKKETGERCRDKEDREREPETARESKAKGNKDREAKKEIKTQEREKRTTEENLLFSSRSSLVSPGFAPPPLPLFSGFHSNREGSTKFAYTFTSFLHNSTGLCIFMRLW